ncbi:hypothetical protein [Variovorax sp. V213]|jgi:hypothetical protein|uniref:hypothetical protein n=1 Tax=Variovorax sp. V213 TaxID=3065955 RepID=UPI0034E879BD
MLRKKDCERIWSDVREAEKAMGWLQWIATKDESWRNPFVINAQYQECKQWPDQLEEEKYTRARDRLMAYDRGELSMSAEDAIRLRGAVNKVQGLYQVSAPYRTDPANYMSEPEKEYFRRFGNNIGMGVSLASIPGVLIARWFDANETVAGQAGQMTSGLLGAAGSAVIAKGQYQPVLRQSPPRMQQDPLPGNVGKPAGASKTPLPPEEVTPSPPSKSAKSGTVVARPPPALPISRQKQNGHVKGTPQNTNRIKQGKPTSTFSGDAAEADRLTQEAWQKGTPVPGRPGVRDYDFLQPIGTGPKGGGQSIVRVHQDASGNIHGHPAGPETP